MTPHDIKRIEHTAFWLPFTRDVTARPYRVGNELKSKLHYVFSHPTLPRGHVQMFLDVAGSGSRGLTNDMGTIAVALTQVFMDNPSQFGGKYENVQAQILIRMWRQVYRHRVFQGKDLEAYLSAKMKTLSIENGLWDELWRVTMEKDYTLSHAGMRKHREGMSHSDTKKPRDERKDATQEGSKAFEFYASLE